MKYLTRTIWILSLVSLFNDISSEFLYPIMPLFLQSIGFTSVLIGILEGLAEATAGLSKGYFGRLSDSYGKRLPFVTLGYLLSAISKSMLGLLTYPIWVFTARSADKLGKGIRTGARDAILSDESTPENKGKVFGFHRGMDTLGAAIGPSLALVYLIVRPGQYQLMFLLAFIPGILAVLLTFFIKEKNHPQASSPAPLEPTLPLHGSPYGPSPTQELSKGGQKTSFRLTQMFNYFKSSPVVYKKLSIALLLFALFNSSDFFLLMKIKAGGLNDQLVIGCYILYNIVFALASFPIGILADKLGLQKTLAFGLLLFAVVYAGFGINSTLFGFLALFVIYGFYAASTDGVSKALISNLVPKGETASAIGTFTGLSSIMALLSSTIAGLIWKYISPEAMFIFSAGGVFISFVFLSFLNLRPSGEKSMFNPSGL